ncbi:hypothetical protein LR48_Vigan02g080800 [Vigna angularis]|uniref:Transposase (putative) gypsy type domain-containing protein n=1 Tax=Phaseolus angularis TaxID=3914 RepID=A0A0L9TVN4_PHAAN|nr:hypothetical protein LR48_Vigan02g080800 [Vigna angularis]
MEEKGQSDNINIPEASSARAPPEIATVVFGERAFVYGQVRTEDSEGASSSSLSDNDYAWASREVSEYSSVFKNKIVLADWVENSCILRSVGYKSCIKMVACSEDERVFHGKESAADDFFYFYGPLFYDLYIRLPLSAFQMDVLRTLNVAPSQLHPNGWGYVQAFETLCQAVGIRPTVPLFLHFFRCRPVAKKGWVSLISESENALLELYVQSYRGFKNQFLKVSILDSGRSFFFDEGGRSKFPLYWTQNPLKFTSWSEDKMTIDELEALGLLMSLPHPLSSRHLINCLEYDDFGARVTEIMGRKGSDQDWFKAIKSERKAGQTSGAARPQSSGAARPSSPAVTVASQEEVIIMEEQSFVRKRTHQAVSKKAEPSKKVKETGDATARSFPRGMSDSALNLSHKIDFNLDESEKKLVESMTEQQMADDLLELSSRAAMAAWHMAYASDMGVLRTELQKVKDQLKELSATHAECEERQRQSQQLMCEAQTVLKNTQRAGICLREERDQLRVERGQLKMTLEQSSRTVSTLNQRHDELLAASVADKELIEELKEAIVAEHTRGFEKALRQVSLLRQVSNEGPDFDVDKDVYQGQLVPIMEIPDDASPENEQVIEPTAAEQPVEQATEDVADN